MEEVCGIISKVGSWGVLTFLHIFPSPFRKVLREMERCLYSNFYASYERENGEIYEGFANVLPGPFRHSLYKEITFFILKRVQVDTKISGSRKTHPRARKEDWSKWACCLLGLKPSWGLQDPLCPPLSKSSGFRTLLGILERRHKSELDWS